MRCIPVLAGVAVVAAPVLAVGMARADAPAVGDGHAQAVFARLVPYLGLPGVDTSLGITTAQVSGGTAQASAGVADFGLIGAIANANAGDSSGQTPKLALPEPISADSQRTQHVDHDPFALPGAPAAPANSPVAGAHESATATQQPLAAVGTATGPDLNLPGILRVTGGSSTSEVHDGRSVADVTISQITLAGGQVVLSGLRWSASEAAGKAGVPTFALASVTVAGQTLPVGGPEQLAAAIEAANRVLDPLGLSLQAPVATTGPAQGDLGPLTLQFRNPESLVAPSTQAGAAARPAVQALTQQVIAAYPDAAAAQIVVNAVLGASSGRSGGRLELGGVSVQEMLPGPSDDDAAPAPAAPAVPAAPPILPAPVGGAPATAAVQTPPVVEPAADPATVVAAAPATVATRAVSYPVQHATSRAVAATAVGIGLVLLLMLALVDRLRAR
ncbi:MAG TPA: hypothetical protein VHV82_13900 [Sporichthyaceae bacterium]|jgi:hypothetical protein|nr:hypothetical protein [Sporichthyaceae bacterium]